MCMVIPHRSHEDIGRQDVNTLDYVDTAWLSKNHSISFPEKAPRD